MLEIRSVATERLRVKRPDRAVFTPGPFLKWAGGKSQLLPTFVRYFPKKFNRYHEPFLGGGAVFFHLASRIPHLRATISDGNEELINCYKMIRDYPYEMLEALKQHRNDKHHFYKIRAQNTSKLTNPERAARLVFLNKTCFNGLYRVNRSGQFNVPFGKYKNPKFVDEKNIFAVSDILTHADISHAPFESVLARAKRGDFVYFDPPYQPLSSTSSFTGYTSGSFSFEDQKRLAEVFTTLHKRGCHLMLSNSDIAPIRELYKNYRIETVYANRAINSKASGRGRITEVLILNY